MTPPKRSPRHLRLLVSRRLASFPRFSALALVAAVLALTPTAADAYIGPGAGIALAGSALMFFVTILVAMVALLAWPFRALLRAIKHRNRPKPWIKRLIIVGFDGQDPKMTERYMAAGLLPNFEKLQQMGGYRHLRTSFPSISPVAWSSFATGTEPARHSIYDFLDRDRRSYLPVLSSAHIGQVDKVFKIGKYRIPLEKPDVRLLRKSKPMWTILGEHDIWSTVLRVPITFPPEKFHGAQLSAMCAPDLHGTQGTFQLYTTRKSDAEFKEGGVRFELDLGKDFYETTIKGPENTFVEGSPTMQLAMQVELDRKAKTTRVTIEGVTEPLDLDLEVLSGWVVLKFKSSLGMKVSGITRLNVLELDDEHFSLYMTPININPDDPAMPISHPSYYSSYLSHKIGHYCTLGLAEDTWALNERVLDDGHFLQQAYDIDQERQDMFFAALDKLRTGTEVCVFDATDRIQHLFWRYEDPDHPAQRGRPESKHKNAIEEIYKHNDVLLGKVMARMKQGDVLMVMSDHGFSSFRRGVNLNSWLLDNGYLFLNEGASGDSEWLRDVDWSRTKAYCLGLSGMFLNLKGREAEGIVDPGTEAEALKQELKQKLDGLVDEAADKVGINELFITNTLYRGPYIGNAPDFIVGYNSGYRSSWDCATGVISGPVFEDNTKPWSGDHCIDPRLVPGILFCNYPIAEEDPSLIDIAPTALTLFGLTPPDYMEGKSLIPKSAFQPKPSKENAA